MYNDTMNTLEELEKKYDQAVMISEKYTKDAEDLKWQIAEAKKKKELQKLSEHAQNEVKRKQFSDVIDPERFKRLEERVLALEKLHPAGNLH